MTETHPNSILRKVTGFPLTRIILAIACFVAASVAGNLLLGLFSTQLNGHKTLSGPLYDVVSAMVFLFSYIGFVKLIERRPVDEFSAEGAGKGLWQGLFISVLLVVFVYGGLMLTGCLKLTGVNPVSYMTIPFFAAISAAVREEILIRGVLYRIIEEKLGTVISLTFTSVLFGALHLMNPHATLTGAVSITLTAGLMLGLAYTYTKKLWLSIGLHFGWNFLTGGIFGTAVSGNEKMPALFNNELSGPEILTGGVFGPEASVLIIIAGLAVSAVFISKAKKEKKLVSPYRKLKKPTP